MNKIDELIEKLCPNGVEYKLLQDVCDSLPKGTLKTTELIDSGEYPVINSGRTFYGNYDKYNNEKNAFIFATRGEYAGFVTYIDTKFWAGGLCYPYRSKNEKFITTKFIYYYLKNNEKSIMKKLVTRGGIPAINKRDIDRIMLPVPPLEIQSEIVYILDKFTALLAELKARKKQYAYYRDMFINKEKNRYLREVLKIKNGKDYKAFEKGNIPVYGSGGIIAYTSKFAYDKPSVLIPRKGSLNKLYYVEEPFWNVDTIFYTEIDEKIAIPKYVFYCLENEHLEELNIAGAVPSLTQSTLNNIKIFIPDLEEQNKIVNILDKLYYLINSISEGIPAEIEARQKQYEYYRDKLLAFKELVIDK